MQVWEKKTAKEYIAEMEDQYMQLENKRMEDILTFKRDRYEKQDNTEFKLELTPREEAKSGDDPSEYKSKEYTQIKTDIIAKLGADQYTPTCFANKHVNSNNVRNLIKERNGQKLGHVNNQQSNFKVDFDSSLNTRDIRHDIKPKFDINR